MKCSLGISNFLEGISSLSHSVVFLYFFALITEEGFLISPCYSLELCIQMGTSFLFSFAFCSLTQKFTISCQFHTQWKILRKNERSRWDLSDGRFNLETEELTPLFQKNT